MKFKKLIVVAMILIMVIGIIYIVAYPKNEELYTQQIKGCEDSGGTVTTSSCCASVDGFPNTCLIGACGCAPSNSHQIKTCNCGENKCFDGEKCI
jgi:hypothetical protein